MRKLVLVIGVIIAVAIGVSLSTLRTRVDRGARTFAEEVAKATGSDVTIGSISFAVFPPAVTVSNAEVSERLSGTEFLKIVEFPSVRVEPRILPLLMGKAQIDAIDVYDPTFRIRRTPNTMPSFLSEEMIRAVVDSPVDVRIHGATVEAVDEIVDPGSRLTAVGIDAEVTSDGETISIDATGAPLGESSRAVWKMRFSPGAGPTGGGALTLETSIAGASADAVKMLFPILADVDLADSIEISLKGEGFVGEKGTEAVPAETWDGTLTAALDVGIAGNAQPTKISAAVSLDDKRFQASSGRGSWGDLNFDVSGWYSVTGNGKLAGRLVLEEFSADALATSFGVAEAWRPQAQVSLSIRMMGKLLEPLFRYEARSEELTLAGFAGYPVSVSPVQARGSILAINAEVNASLDCENLKVGEFGWDEALVSLTYWREKLRVNAGDAEIWGGLLSGGYTYFPRENGRSEIGGVFSAGDAGQLLSAAAPSSKIPLRGSTDWVMRATSLTPADEWSGFGRIGVHDGAIGERNYLRELLASAFSDTPGVVDTLARSNGTALSSDETRFRRAAFDLERTPDGYAVHAVDIDMYGARLIAEARASSSKQGVFATGTLELSPSMSRELVGEVPGVASLIGVDGFLRIPVEGSATANEIDLRVDPEFPAALKSAAAGRPVSPFSTAEVEDVPASSNMPSLLQQFGR
jgi:hypothetical protein